MILSTMHKAARDGLIPGRCAHCRECVFESLALLDDAYNVWCGKCPHCGALNYLGLNSLRGYSSAGMSLVLPTDEEKIANNLPADCPSRGSHGPASAHGSVAGELLHQLNAAITKAEGAS